MKKQNFDTEGREAKLNRPSSLPPELSELLRGLFNGMYKRYGLYRATGVVLMDLIQDTRIQYSLFEDPLRAEKIRELYEAVDALSGKYGKHTLHLGASHPIEVRGKGRRGTPPSANRRSSTARPAANTWACRSSRRKSQESDKVAVCFPRR